MQSQKAVSAYFTCEQMLPYGFTERTRRCQHRQNSIYGRRKAQSDRWQMEFVRTDG